MAARQRRPAHRSIAAGRIYPLSLIQAPPTAHYFLHLCFVCPLLHARTNKPFSSSLSKLSSPPRFHSFLPSLASKLPQSRIHPSCTDRAGGRAAGSCTDGPSSQGQYTTTMKLVWCPDTASKAYIDGVRAIADGAHDSDSDNGRASDGSPELAELVAAMAGGWNAQLIVDAPDNTTPPSSSRRPPATSLALAAAARRTGARYACLDVDDAAQPHPDDAINDDSVYGASSSAVEAAMAQLEGVDLLVLDARRQDASAVLRAARPGPRGMVVVRHGDVTGGMRRRAPAPPWGTLAAGTRVVRAAYLPIGAGGVEVLHVGVGKGPSLQLPTTTTHNKRTGGGGRGRWIRHVNHRTGEEHVFRRQ